MKSSLTLGIILIAIGVFVFAYKGITYKTDKKVVDVGPLEIHDTKKETIPLSPILGVVALAGGLFLVVNGARKAA